jgi:hypothetical protein
MDLADFYGYSPTERQVELYGEVLSRFPYDIVRDCMKSYMTNPKNHHFPIPPHKIITERYPELAPPEPIKAPGAEEEAKIVAGNILTAISRFGSYQSSKAREFLGEVGWEVVKRQGGWLAVCEMVDNKNQGMVQAQWRELALSVIKMSSVGRLQEAPSLPESRHTPQIGQPLRSLGDLMALRPPENEDMPEGL